MTDELSFEVSGEEKGKYYPHICEMIGCTKYAYKDSLIKGARDTLENIYGFLIDEEEFEHSLTWALADCFGDGMEAEE